MKINIEIDTKAIERVFKSVKDKFALEYTINAIKDTIYDEEQSIKGIEEWIEIIEKI